MPVSDGCHCALVFQGGEFLPTAIQRRLHVGAEPMGGGVHFRVWAPDHDLVEIVPEGSRGFEMEREANGYFAGMVESAGPGTLYRFRIDRGDKLFPDPAS